MHLCRQRGARLIPLLVMFGVGCRESAHPPGYQPKDKTDPVDAGFEIPIDEYDASVPPPPEDLSNFCGNLVIPIQAARPNLYFVLDRSGSMRDSMPDPTNGKPIEKFIGARQAVHDVLFSLGHRVAYGAAVFPRFGNIGTCDAGSEINKLAPGDAVTYARNGLDGPHLARLMDSLSLYVPEGATPTASTLEKLVAPLTALEGETTVILATDGAPNCNQEATCDAEHCIPSIEGSLLPNGTRCSSAVNCCDPTSYYGPLNCIDADSSVAPISELLAKNVKTYVIGLPGSEAYEATLNRFAVAGGTARAGGDIAGLNYYAVTDTEELKNILVRITADIAISCNIALGQVPPDWSQVNLYLDNSLVLMSPEDGWQQLDPQTLEITGGYCELLKSGNVFQVQVVAGCATQVLL